MFNDSSLDEVIKALLNQKYPGSVSWDREKWDTKHRIIVEISESEFGPHTAEVFGSTDEISELATALNKALGV